MNKTIVYMISTLFYPSIGGVENVIYNLSKELIQRGYIVKVIQPILNSTTTINHLEGIEVHQIGVGNKKDKQNYDRLKHKSKDSILGYLYGYRRKSYFNRFYKQIFKYVNNDIEQEKQKGHIDNFVIHQHDFISSIKLSKKIAKQNKVIFTNHTGEFLFLKKLPFSKYIIYLLTNHFSFIISPSEELNSFKEIRSKNTYKFIPNGVDVKKFNLHNEKQKAKERSNLDIKKSEIVILCPRRWAPTKGIIYFVKSINLLINEFNVNNIKFLFAGDNYSDYPEYKQEIDDYIKCNKLEKYIIRMGNVKYDNMDKIIKVSDIVVIPSLMEAISLAALEAMACGKIVVATAVGGLLQIIDHGKNGFIVQPKDEKNLAQTLYKIITNIEEYRNIGVNARKLVEEQYSWATITDKHIEIYNKHGLNK